MTYVNFLAMGEGRGGYGLVKTKIVQDFVNQRASKNICLQAIIDHIEQITGMGNFVHNIVCNLAFLLNLPHLSTKI